MPHVNLRTLINLYKVYFHNGYSRFSSEEWEESEYRKHFNVVTELNTDKNSLLLLWLQAAPPLRRPDVVCVNDLLRYVPYYLQIEILLVNKKCLLPLCTNSLPIEGHCQLDFTKGKLNVFQRFNAFRSSSSCFTNICSFKVFHPCADPLFPFSLWWQ